MKRFLIFLLIVAAAVGGWYFGRGSRAPMEIHGGGAAGERVPLFYQSPMHPWIKSDKPGNCTICGMKLVAVYEGDKALDNGGEQAGVRLNPQSINVLHVETLKVRREALKRTLRVAGSIDDDDSKHRRLSAYVDGRIDRLLVDHLGAEVREGEPMVHLYSPALLAARDEYLLLARQQSATAPRMLESARARLIRMGMTAAQVERLPGEKTHPEYIEILAPMTGTVVERKVYAGQYVKEGEVLFEIADFSRMWFLFDAYERDLSWIRIGEPVDVSTPSVPGQVFSAPIAFIDPNLMPQTRSAKVRVEIENPLVGDPPRRTLLHRVYAEALIRAEVPDTLAVPRSAVLSPGGDPLVYVEAGPGRYEPRRVRLGRAGDTLWEVLDGLKEGEAIVSTGNLLIDAQAQLDKGPQEPPLAAPSGELSALQKTAAREFLTEADALAGTLAADDLSAFNKQAAKLHASLDALSQTFGPDVQKVAAAGHFSAAFDLPAARKSFYAFSSATAQFASALRTRDPGFASLKVFECPMAKAAVPSASSDKGQWVQLKLPMRNPFFGKEMPDCGTEVAK